MLEQNQRAREPGAAATPLTVPDWNSYGASGVIAAASGYITHADSLRLRLSHNGSKPLFDS